MDVLLTGATGFVGRPLLDALLAAGHRVTALLRDPETSGLRPSGALNLVRFDMLRDDPAELDLRVEALVHLAWPGLDDYTALFHVERVLPASYALVRASIAQGARRILVTGTCQEYGLAEGALAPDRPTAPTTAYAEAKDMLHRQLRLLAAREGADLVWVRLFFLHGPGQRAKSLFAQLEAAVRRGDTAFNMSAGEQLRDYLHVEAAADQIVGALTTASPGPINICSGVPRSVRGLVEDWLQERGAEIRLNLGHYPYPPHEPMAFWGLKGA